MICFFYLIEHGANIHIKNGKGVPLFMKLMECKMHKILNYLFKKKRYLIIDLDMNESYSPLIKAIYRDQIESVRSILNEFNKPNDRTVKRRCIGYKESPFKPLVLAYLLDRKEIFSLLMDHNPSLIHLLDRNGYSILYYAILREDYLLVKQLLDKGAVQKVISMI